jgi:hypothetical protein
MVIAAAVLIVWPIFAAAAGPPAGQEDKQSNARLGLFKRIVEQVDVSIDDGGKPVPVKMMAEPLYRYRQKPRSMSEAVVWGWSDGGRPAAIVTLAIDGDARTFTYEFAQLSPKSLACAIDGQEAWAPRGGLEMSAFPKAPAPAEDAPARLKQVGQLLARLKGTVAFNNAPAGEPPQGDLAWLPKPIHRYSDEKQGIVDGFICLSCIEDFPQVAIVLEVQRRENSASEWRYGFNRTARDELHMSLDNKEIWKAWHLNSTAARYGFRFISAVVPAAAEGEGGDDDLNSLLRAIARRHDDRKTRYAVPQGDVAVLKKWVERLVKFRPVEAADVIEHERRFRPALNEAAERIVRLEKDHDSEAYQAARYILLGNRVYWLARALPAEQRRVIADVKEYLKEQIKAGNTNAAISLGETSTRTLQRMGQGNEAIALYESFGAQYSRNSDSDVAEFGRTMRAASAHLRELNATAPKPHAPEVAPRGKLTTIDLSSKANRPILTDAYNGLAELPKGEQSFAGVIFAIGDRMLQLEGPFHGLTKISGIAVGRKLRRLYLLQGTLVPERNGVDHPEGETAAVYKIHYADGSEDSLPVEYGKDVRGWYDLDEGKPVSRGRVVWTGTNAASRRENVTLRLYLGIWENPHPERPVATIDFTKPDEPRLAPLCVAITAEE